MNSLLRYHNSVLSSTSFICFMDTAAPSWGRPWHYSHSVVPGGLEVRSYNTLDIPGTVEIRSTIWFNTWREKKIKSMCYSSQGVLKCIKIIDIFNKTGIKPVYIGKITESFKKVWYMRQREFLIHIYVCGIIC